MGNIGITHTSRTDSHRMFKLGGDVEYATCPGPPPERGTGAVPLFLAHVYCRQTVDHFSYC